MIMNLTSLHEDKLIIEGLNNLSIKRLGSLILHRETNHIIGNIISSHSITNTSKYTSYRDFLKILSDVFKVAEVESTLNLKQIPIAGNILNMLISDSYYQFTYMKDKFEELKNSIDKLHVNLNQGLELLHNDLFHISEQLEYIRLLVEDNKKEQQRCIESVSLLQKMFLTEKMIDFKAVIAQGNRFPDVQGKESLNTVFKARELFKDIAGQYHPQLDSASILNIDIAIQGWALGIAIEAQILLETGNIQIAKELLAEEVLQFKHIVEAWCNKLIEDPISEIETVYRFATPLFKDYISQERVDRISMISSRDSCLSLGQRRNKKNSAEIELSLSKHKLSNQFNRVWIHKQIGISQFLDTMSEIWARLESLQTFVNYCLQVGIKSSRELFSLVDKKDGIYILKHT